MPVAAGFFLGADRPGLGPAQARDRAAVAGLGEQPVDLAPGGGVVGGADHAGDLGRGGPAEHGDPAGAQRRLQAVQRPADLGGGLGQPGGRGRRGRRVEGDADPGVHVGGGGRGSIHELAHDLPGGQRRGRVERGGHRVGQRRAGFRGGVDGDRHVPHRGEVAEGGEPAAPVRHPGVRVLPVGQPGRGGDDPQRRGHHPGAAVQHQGVPAAVAVLGVQQRQRGQHPGQPPGGGMLGDDRDPVPGPVPGGGVAPACPPQRGQGQRLAADPGQAGAAAGQQGRRHVQQGSRAGGGGDDQHQQGAQHGGGPAEAEAEQADPAAQPPAAVVPRALVLVCAHHLSPAWSAGGCIALAVALRPAP